MHNLKESETGTEVLLSPRACLRQLHATSQYGASRYFAGDGVVTTLIDSLIQNQNLRAQILNPTQPSSIEQVLSKLRNFVKLANPGSLLDGVSVELPVFVNKTSYENLSRTDRDKFYEVTEHLRQLSKIDREWTLKTSEQRSRMKQALNSRVQTIAAQLESLEWDFPKSLFILDFEGLDQRQLLKVIAKKIFGASNEIKDLVEFQTLIGLRECLSQVQLTSYSPVVPRLSLTVSDLTSDFDLDHYHQSGADDIFNWKAMPVSDAKDNWSLISSLGSPILEESYREHFMSVLQNSGVFLQSVIPTFEKFPSTSFEKLFDNKNLVNKLKDRCASMYPNADMGLRSKIERLYLQNQIQVDDLRELSNAVPLVNSLEGAHRLMTLETNNRRGLTYFLFNVINLVRNTSKMYCALGADPYVVIQDTTKYVVERRKAFELFFIATKFVNEVCVHVRGSK